MMSADKAEMRNCEKWAKDKNPLFATIALIIASSVEDCYELFESVKQGNRIEGNIHLPQIKTWLSLYRNPKRVARGLIKALRNIDDNIDKTFIYWEKKFKGSERIKKMIEEKIRDGKNISDGEVRSIIKEIFRNFEEEIMKDGEFIIKEDIIEEYDREHDMNEEQKERITKALRKPEIIFFVRVLFPCLSIHGIYPIDLLRRAQDGDEDALENLIRLDKSAIFDRKISEMVHQAQTEKIPGRMNRIKVAFKSLPKVYMTSTKIEYMLGGLISFMSIMMGQKITAVEIERLFTAIALDTGKGYSRSRRPRTAHEYKKAVRRYSIFWSSVLPAEGQKIFHFMSA